MVLCHARVRLPAAKSTRSKISSSPESIFVPSTCEQVMPCEKSPSTQASPLEWNWSPFSRLRPLFPQDHSAVPARPSSTFRFAPLAHRAGRVRGQGRNSEPVPRQPATHDRADPLALCILARRKPQGVFPIPSPSALAPNSSGQVPVSTHEFNTPSPGNQQPSIERPRSPKPWTGFPACT